MDEVVFVLINKQAEKIENATTKAAEVFNSYAHSPGVYSIIIFVDEVEIARIE